MKTVVGLFDDMSEARAAAKDLEAAGIPSDDISIVANNEGGRYVPTDTTTTGEPTVTGHAIGHDAVVGAEIGAVGGLVLGLTGLAIPGLGWIAGAGWLMGTVLGAGTGAIVGGLVGALTHVGVPAEDAAHYNEGVRRGGTLVAVKAQDDMAQSVAEILGNDGAVDIDERAAHYAETGYGTGTSAYSTSAATTGYTAPVTSATTGYIAPATTEAATSYAADSTTAYNSTDSAVIPVVEEELQVGKREVQRGGVRVYTHMTETPVEQQVTLHEEHVTVDRTPVNRTASQSDIDAAMQSRSIELTETAEEAVIAKQARVVEEVSIGKTGSDHTETVRDTVRRTDVDVEELEDDEVPVHTSTSVVH